MPVRNELAGLMTISTVATFSSGLIRKIPKASKARTAGVAKIHSAIHQYVRTSAPIGLRVVVEK